MKNVLFLDFYGTIVTRINEQEGDTFWNLMPNLPMWEAIKMMKPDYIFVVENENCPEKPVMRNYQMMYEYFRRSLSLYLGKDSEFVEYDICPFLEEENEYCKPNLGIYRKKLWKNAGADYMHPFDDPDMNLLVVGHETDKEVADRIGCRFVHTNEVLSHLIASHQEHKL